MLLVLSENWTLTGGRADLSAAVRWAREAEDAGFDAVMVSEHIVLGPDAAAAGIMGNPRDYALPGNQDPLRHPHPPHPFALFAATGVAAALAGAIKASVLDSAVAGTSGSGFELTVLTAVLLGGVALTGGSGSILGVLLGVLFLGGLQNGLTLLNVPTFWQQMAQGVALVAGAALAYFAPRTGR